MGNQIFFDNYPGRIVAASNFVTVSLYVLGGFLVGQLGSLWLCLYVVAIISIELRLMGWHCVDCYYYGKKCAFGRGRLSALLFKRGEPRRFNQRVMRWKDLIPDFMITLVPVMVGVVALFRDFNWITLSLVTAMLVLGTSGVALVRERLACKHCKQREIGCPAADLFEKSRKKK